MMYINISPRPETPDESYYARSKAHRWGVLLLVLGLIWLVFELASRGLSMGFGLGIVERSVEVPPQSFTAAHLVVRGTNDNIFLDQAAGNQITVSAVRHASGWSADVANDALNQLDLQITQHDDTLQVEVQRIGGFSRFIGRSPYVDLHISVPAGAGLDVQTMNGTLQADGLHADGSMSTINGDISLMDSAGELHVSSTNGDIHMAGSFSHPQVETVNGEINLDGADGRISVHSISGDLQLHNLRDALLDLKSTNGDIELDGTLAHGESSQISTISGDVAASLPSVSDLRVDVNTINGDLSSNLDLRDAQRDRRNLRGTIGSGQTTLTISTTNGDVDLNGE
ncbi:MAG: DUF4097 domain-containing protein [Oscillochloris sp.]|nr:DUF4097 domain-containing protein [Oscillochloris sp.]